MYGTNLCACLQTGMVCELNRQPGNNRVKDRCWSRMKSRLLTGSTVWASRAGRYMQPQPILHRRDKIAPIKRIDLSSARLENENKTVINISDYLGIFRIKMGKYLFQPI